ncbi:Putative ribonuclease H protein At1g65750 [Linum perenne]
MKSGGERGISWMRWERLCVRKEDGGMGFKDMHAFNLAMLGKARYFPRGDFLTAACPKGSSPIWQSIWATQVDTPADGSLAGLRVCDLFIPGERAWDVEMIEELFSERDAAAIVEIPLHASLEEDGRLWHHSKCGNYTVRSGYKLIMHSLVPRPHLATAGPWNNIWGLEAPPRLKTFLWRVARGVLPTRLSLQNRHIRVPTECGLCNRDIENSWHLFLNCPVARQCWDVGGYTSIIEDGMGRSESMQDWVFFLAEHVDAIKAAEITAILNSIWRERNSRVWTEKATLPIAIVRDGLESLKSWINVRHASKTTHVRSPSCGKWHPPPNNVLKCNIDAAVFGREGRRGVGIVIRGTDGALQTYRMSAYDGVPTATECEALALLEAVTWAGQLNLGATLFEVDSQVVADAVRAGTGDVTEFGGLIRSICHQLRDSWNVVFVRRTGNSAAHLLARQSKNHASTTIGYASPTWLIDALNDSCFACEH